MPASPNEYQVNPASVSQVKTLAENLFLKHFTAYLENWLSSSLKPFHWTAQISYRTEVRQEPKGNADCHQKSDRVRVAVKNQKDDFSSNQSDQNTSHSDFSGVRSCTPSRCKAFSDLIHLTRPQSFMTYRLSNVTNIQK